jgi:hypothetical protein
VCDYECEHSVSPSSYAYVAFERMFVKYTNFLSLCACKRTFAVCGYPPSYVCVVYERMFVCKILKFEPVAEWLARSTPMRENRVRAPAGTRTFSLV